MSHFQPDDQYYKEINRENIERVKRSSNLMGNPHPLEIVWQQFLFGRAWPAFLLFALAPFAFALGLFSCLINLVGLVFGLGLIACACAALWYGFRGACWPTRVIFAGLIIYLLCSHFAGAAGAIFICLLVSIVIEIIASFLRKNDGGDEKN